MKKMLIIVPHLGIGGQERIAVQAAEILSQYLDVRLVVFERVEHEYFTKLPVINLQAPAQVSLLKKLWQVCKRNYLLKKLKKEKRVDYVISVGDIANVSNAFSKVKAVKTFMWVHGYGSVPQSKKAAALLKMIYKRADKVLCVSRQIAQDMAKVTRLPHSLFQVMYNGYDIEHIQKKSDEHLEFSDETIVTVGRLEEVKGHAHLIRAFSELYKQARVKPKLIFVGEGSCEKQLKHLCVAQRVEQSVDFVGRMDNPYKYMKNATIVVMSSLHEGFPNVLVEALATGAAIVSVDCLSGPRELLSPSMEKSVNDVVYGEYGILTPAFKTEMAEENASENLLAQGMKALLEDEKARETYQKKAVDRAWDFSLQNFEESLLGLL